mgnify:CR=1 FL=1
MTTNATIHLIGPEMYGAPTILLVRGSQTSSSVYLPEGTDHATTALRARDLQAEYASPITGETPAIIDHWQANIDELTPANNTEARQQAAADLEQVESESYDLGGETLTVLNKDADTVTFTNTANPGIVSSLPRAEFYRDLPRVIAFCAHQPARQSDLFAARVDDLPIFSGTAPRATVRPFVETPASPRQPKLL